MKFPTSVFVIAVCLAAIAKLSAGQEAVRLLNGTDLVSTYGFVEVLYSNTWGCVCDDSFGDNDNGAKVACKMLGYNRGRFIPYTNATRDGLVRTSTSKIWLDDVRCTGTETALDYCSHSTWGTHNCGHEEDSAVECSDPIAAPSVPLTVWPQPSQLLGFWPINSVFLFSDVNALYTQNTKVLTQSYATTTGPYGQSFSAVKPAQNGVGVMQVTSNKLNLNSSFTVTLFFSSGGTSSTRQGGIFEFLDSYGTKNAFQIRYMNSTTIEVAANGRSIGNYTMIQQQNAWTFIGLVFDINTEMFTVYGKHGVVKPATYQPHIWAPVSFSNNGIRLGYASRWSQGLTTLDGVSCLMIYKTALTASEIYQARDACRIVHGTAPCGSPKLPLTTFPSGTTATTVPKPGQFPYVASIRYRSNPACSASILDEFWVVTSSRCVADSLTTSNYVVYVGEHDVGVTESYTRSYTVSKIIVPSNPAKRDLALIQVSTPIDFTSEYVNDVCLFRGNSNELDVHEIQYVPGWGKNGRSPLLSQTLPRYVPGRTLTVEQCQKGWSDDFNSVKDYCFLSASTDKNVPCSGDEGSPLLYQSPADPSVGRSERLITLGIYYGRDVNCTAAKPPLFTNVVEYNGWIAEKLACAVPGYIYPESCPQS